MTETLSVSIENYLETIFLISREHHVARVKDISDRLKVSRPSVTGMLQTLRDREFVNYEPYQFVTLTPKGEAIAKRVARRHEALRDFMVHVLSIDYAEADEAACHMEHGISKHVVDRFLEFSEFVQTCPRAGAKWVHGFGYSCGEAVLSSGNCERCIEQCLEEVKRKSHPHADNDNENLTLDRLKEGEKGQIVKVGGAGAIKRRIRDMGVTTGSLVEVIRLAPLGGPMEVKVKGYRLTLRREEAADVSVRRIEK